MLKEPIYTKGKITDGSKAHCGGLCPCFGNVTVYDNPKLFDINEDPEQIRPIEGDMYDKVVPSMLRKLEHLKEDEARNNMKSQLGQMWRYKQSDYSVEGGI